MQDKERDIGFSSEAVTAEDEGLRELGDIWANHAEQYAIKNAPPSGEVVITEQDLLKTRAAATAEWLNNI